MGIVIEVILPAEKDHFVGDQRLIDRCCGLGVDSAQAYSVDARADVFT
jgi:hypothetical protein